jgi:hypothetical protein
MHVADCVFRIAFFFFFASNIQLFAESLCFEIRRGTEGRVKRANRGAERMRLAASGDKENNELVCS